MCSRGKSPPAALAGVDESEFNRCCALLGVESTATLEDIERVFLKKNFALIRSGATTEREQLRAAYDAIIARLKRPGAPPASLRLPDPAGPGSASRPVPVYVPPPPDPTLLHPGSFDSWRVNLLALPLALGLAFVVSLTPFRFLLAGFHVWMHEFGHATVAWLTGRRALPLPIGWTNVSPEKSLFVYGGVLFLLGLLFAAGWKERKLVPLILAPAVALLQGYMSWVLSDDRAALWQTFAGVGGEFYLSTACMVLFYFPLPEKFKWSYCRYVFLFIGATSFLNIWLFWRQVRRGEESIPWGSMVNGEEDAGGDMNILRDDYHWSNHQIMGAYQHLGTACLVVLLAAYLFFALRLDRLARRLTGGAAE